MIWKVFLSLLFSGKEKKVKVTQSCLTLCNPINYTVHGILQARILEWVALPFSRGSSEPRDRIQVSHITVDSLPAEPQWKPKNTGMSHLSFFQRSSQPRNQTGASCIAGGFFTNWVIREPTNFHMVFKVSFKYTLLPAFRFILPWYR